MTPEWISAITALVAVTIGPFASIYVAKRQIKLSTISNNRAEWIKQFRELIASLLLELRFRDDEIVRGTGLVVNKDSYNNRLRSLFHTERQIFLMLNSDDPEHQELNRVIKIAVTYAGNISQYSLKRVEDQTAIVFNQAQKVIKKEWDLVKTGK